MEMMTMSEQDPDHEALLDHCALECMHAMESKDTEKFVDALHVLVGDILHKMSKPEES